MAQTNEICRVAVYQHLTKDKLFFIILPEKCRAPKNPLHEGFPLTICIRSEKAARQDVINAIKECDRERRYTIIDHGELIYGAI